MKKSAEELLEEISDFLVIYLKSGKILLNSFLKKTDLAISEQEQLFKIHFLLQEEVRDFVSELPELIRHFKTSTHIAQDMNYGEIRGQIHWQKTINERIRVNYRDKTIFYIQARNREYTIKENIVLSELLHIIYNLLFHELDSKRLENFHWFATWGSLKKIVQHIVQKNVYLSRVRRDQFNVTDRMILDTLKQRNPLYRRAAKLLQQYRSIVAGVLSHEELKRLLSETFIQPQNVDVLFELYSVVKLMEKNTKQAELYLIDGVNNLVASWNDEVYEYRLYHDSVGSGAVQFFIDVDEVKRVVHPVMEREIAAIEETERITQQLFQKNFTATYWSGRPDILVEVYRNDTKELARVVIGEVKYTPNIGYAMQGLKELIKYMKLAKDESTDFLEQNVPVHGVLFTGMIEGAPHRLSDLVIKDAMPTVVWIAF